MSTDQSGATTQRPPSVPPATVAPSPVSPAPLPAPDPKAAAAMLDGLSADMDAILKESWRQTGEGNLFSLKSIKQRLAQLQTKDGALAGTPQGVWSGKGGPSRNG